MKNLKVSFGSRYIPLFLVALLLAGGCTSLRELNSTETEKYLAASGFQARPANTPQRRTALATLIPYKLQTRIHKGQIYYIYPDPAKNFLYVGGSKEYTNYQKLNIRQEIVQQQEMTAMEWNNWGPWSFGTPGSVYW